MSNLLETIVNFVNAFLDLVGFMQGKVDQDKAMNAIEVIKLCTTEIMLNQVLGVLPGDVTRLAMVNAAVTAQRDAIKNGSGIDPFKPIAADMYHGFQDLMEEIRPLLEQAIKDAEGESAVLAAAVGGLFTGSLTGMFYKMFDAMGRPIPSDQVDKLIHYVEPMLTLGLIWEFSTDAAELIHPMKNIGLGNISHFLYDTVSFRQWSEAYSNPFRYAAIEHPSEEAIYTLLQPFNPSARFWRRMYMRREIEKTDVYEILRAEGLKEKYIEPAIESIWTPISLLNLLTIVEYSHPSDTFMHDTLQKSGYSDENIPIIEEMLNQRLINSTIANIYSVYKGLYSSGKLSRSEYETFLESQGISIDRAKGVLDAIDLDLDLKDKDEIAKMFELKFKNGRSSAEDLTTNLEHLGKTPEYIKNKIDMLTLQRIGKLSTTDEDKSLTKADYISAFKLGLITEDNAIANLDNIGYTADDAKFLVDLAARSDDTSVMRLSRTDIINAYKIEMLTRDETLQFLINRGYTAGDAEFIVTLQDLTAESKNKSG